MKIRRRTAVLACLAILFASLGVAGFLVTRPARLRGFVTSALQEIFREGIEVELDDVRFQPLQGMVTVEGLRFVKSGPGREVVLRVPTAVVEARLWDLVGHLRPSELRFYEPELLVEVTADGRIPLQESLAATGGGAPGARPRIRVFGGKVRLRAEGILDAGEEVCVEVESIDWQASRSGGPSHLEGAVRETGSARAGGKGALGRMVVRGECPPARKGLEALAEKVTWDEDLLRRLSPQWRERLSWFTMTGTFGSGPEEPGLAFSVAQRPDRGGLVFGGALRPRGVDFLLREFPLPFRGVEGDVLLDDGALRIERFALRYKKGGVHVQGTIDRLAADAPFDVRFWAREFPVDRDLRDALPHGVQRVLDAYGFTGVLDVTGAPTGTEGSYDSFVRRREGGPLEVIVKARVLDGRMSYVGYEGPGGVRRGFDYPVERITGRADVSVRGADFDVALQDVRGFHGDSPVTAGGTVRERDRGGAEVAIAIVASEIPLDDAIRRAAPAMEGIWRAWSPRGVAKSVRVNVDQVLGVDRGAHEGVTVELDGRAGFRWERLPLPLEKVRGVVHYGNNLVDGRRVPIYEVQEMRAECDGATFAAGGAVEGEGDARIHLDVRAEGLQLDGALARAIREAPVPSLVDLLDRLAPAGTADLTAILTGTESDTREAFRLDLRGASVQGWGDVKFPVTGLEGAVEVRPATASSPEEVSLAGLRGTWEGREVRVEGSVLSPSEAAVLNLRLRVPDAPLDEESLRGILGSAASTLDGYFSFVRPGADLRGDAEVRLQGPASSLDPAVVVEALHGGAAPMGLRELEVTGGRAAYAAGTATLADLTGTLAGKEFRVPAGRADLAPGEGTLRVEVRGLRFPRDLVGLLPEETAAALEGVLPDRNAHMEDLHVSLSEGFRRIQLDGAVVLAPVGEGARGGIDLAGDFRLDRVVLRRGPAESDPVEIAGGIDLSRASFTTGVRVEDLQGRLDLGGSFGTGAGGVTATLSRASGHVEGRELKEAGAGVVYQDGVLVVREVRGTLAGGALGASFEVGGAAGAYRGKVTLSRADAALVLAPADPASGIRGRVEANLSFANESGEKKDLAGRGTVDVVDAKLFKVPVFDKLYALLLIKDTPEFTKAHLGFDLKGERLVFHDDGIVLESTVLGIHKAPGTSSVWFDGRLHVKIVPEFKALTPGPLGWIWSIPSLVWRPIFEQIYTVYVRGTIQKPEVSHEFFGILFAPESTDKPVFLPPPPAVVVERRPPWDF